MPGFALNQTRQGGNLIHHPAPLGGAIVLSNGHLELRQLCEG